MEKKLCILLRKITRRYFRWFIKFPSSERIITDLKKVELSHKKIFVFPSPGSPWGYMFQRPQQIARSLSEQGYPVIYCVNEKYPEDPDWNVRGLLEIESNLYLLNDGNDGQLLRNIGDSLVIWQYWPHQYSSVKKIITSKSTVIYDCIDHLSTFLQYNEINTDYVSSINRAEIILATSDLLYQELKEQYDDVYLAPNGVRIEDFTSEFLYDTVNTIHSIQQYKQEGKQIIGYYGAIAEWMDFEILEYCAVNNANWQIIIVGQIYPDIKMKKINNISYFERLDYKYIPNLLKEFDIGIVPFKITEITKNTSPVKVFEYMAGKKPIVSTRLPEVLKYESILIANDKFEFENQIKKALTQKDNLDYIKKLEYDVSYNTWGQRVSLVEGILKERNILD